MGDRALDDDRLAIAKRMATLRGERSQRRFAARIGVHQQNYCRYESPTRPIAPNVDTLLKLARIEGINLNWLLLGEGPMRWRDPHPDPAEQAAQEAPA